MTDDATADDETQDEKEEAAATGETPDEAHRAGEYDELRDLIASAIAKIDALTGFITQAAVDRPATEPAPEAPQNEGLKNLEDIDFD